MCQKNAIFSDLEDMLMDFLVYRKSKQLPQLNIQSDYQIGKGWPHYKQADLPEMQDIAIENQFEIPAESLFPKPISDLDVELEAEHMRQMYCEINVKLEPYVEQVLSRNEYVGSPMLEQHVDKKYIEQIIDQVVEIAATDLQEVDGIINENERYLWNRGQMLRAIIEGHVLRNLHWKRRFPYNTPKRKKPIYNPYL